MISWKSNSHETALNGIKQSMRFPALILAMTTMMAFHVTGVPVIERNGVLYASGGALEREAEIAIKELPSQKPVAACHRERCALVANTIRIKGELFVPVLALADALGGKAVLDEQRKRVRFEFASDAPLPTESIARVGGLVPNLRLTTLEGKTVSLADFRGKRVLINSWASW
jgi:hypothetical protein